MQKAHIIHKSKKKKTNNKKNTIQFQACQSFETFF